MLTFDEIKQAPELDVSTPEARVQNLIELIWATCVAEGADVTVAVNVSLVSDLECVLRRPAA